VVRSHALSPHLVSFIGDQIHEEVRAGAAVVWGTGRECVPPHLVLPIGCQPSEPRHQQDARFLNLGDAGRPFSYEGLQHLPHLSNEVEFGFNIDLVSGYWHVRL
jgi:hypothetical protein